MRENGASDSMNPDFASLHPGYGCFEVYSAAARAGCAADTR